jgi:hypothetical protein
MFGRATFPFALIASALAPGGLGLLCTCEPLRDAVSSPSIAEIAREPVTPLATPTRTMKGGKGDADVTYPADFAVTIKSDGTVVFPQHTVGHIKGSSIFVGDAAVLTAEADGAVKGIAVKHRYRFEADGALLDERGRGARILPDGGVRGVGGEWQYKSVLAWSPEGGGDWDKKAWRTLEIVALVMLENMLPQALRGDEPASSASASHAGKDADKSADKNKGLTIRIPPPSEWFK